MTKSLKRILDPVCMMIIPILIALSINMSVTSCAYAESITKYKLSQNYVKENLNVASIVAPYNIDEHCINLSEKNIRENINNEVQIYDIEKYCVDMVECKLKAQNNIKDNAIEISMPAYDIEKYCIELAEKKVQEEKQKEDAKKLEEQLIISANTTYKVSTVSPYEGYITEYMDLKNRIDITTDQMNTIIDYWVNGRESQFTGHGNAFIDASKQTGLDPIFLLALAAQEAGWEVSDLHSSKNNPYSINMTDENPSGGYNLGDSFYDGIVNGAIWINENYYNAGQTTLYDMIYGSKEYCTTDGWISSIVSIMNRSYKLII